MIKSILKFCGLTFLIAAVGTILTVSGAGSENALTGLATMIGLLLFVTSPVISFLIIWLPKRRERKRITQESASKQAEEEMKDFLRRRFLERNRLIDAVDTHRTALTRNLSRAIKKNDYGKIERDLTDEAIFEFFSSIDLDDSVLDFENAKQIVFEQLEFQKEEDLARGFDPTDLPFDGHAFEQWVCDALTGFGWEASVTSGSGDQGIDVIAQKDGFRIGIQCKLYSQPVGNKAVQEAHSGKVFYGLDAAAVVTNAGFTRSATDLGLATGILLLSHHDIPNLDTAIDA
ncbi:restriction endonuclease [Celeribacter sp.]|uniref:restriction endonuclease n=1 Tax=Celeribacter sp. TaxID=1890673 RepID=UPI003A90917C